MKKKIISESLPGIFLVVLGVFTSHYGGTGLSALPITASFILFLTASLASKNVLGKYLVKLYAWKYYGILSPLLFIVPLFLMLHVGYEYAYLTTEHILELATSMLVGIGGFLAVHPVLKVL